MNSQIRIGCSLLVGFVVAGCSSSETRQISSIQFHESSTTIVAQAPSQFTADSNISSSDSESTLESSRPFFKEEDASCFEVQTLGALLGRPFLVTDVSFIESGIQIKLWNQNLKDYDTALLDADALTLLEYVVPTEEYLFQNQLTWQRPNSNVVYFQGKPLVLPDYETNAHSVLSEDQQTVVYVDGTKRELLFYDLRTGSLHRQSPIAYPDAKPNQLIYCVQMMSISDRYLLLYLMQGTEPHSSISPMLGYALLDLDNKSISKLIFTGDSAKVRQIGQNDFLFVRETGQESSLVSLEGDSIQVKTIPPSEANALLFQTEYSANGLYSITWQEDDPDFIQFSVRRLDSRQDVYQFTVLRSALPYWDAVYPASQFVFLSNDARTVIFADDDFCTIVQKTNLYP